MMSDPDPFEEGQRAARKNIPAEGNPYRDGSEEHSLWAAGHESVAGEGRRIASHRAARPAGSSRCAPMRPMTACLTSRSTMASSWAAGPTWVWQVPRPLHA